MKTWFALWETTVKGILPGCCQGRWLWALQQILAGPSMVLKKLRIIKLGLLKWKQRTIPALKKKKNLPGFISPLPPLSCAPPTTSSSGKLIFSLDWLLCLKNQSHSIKVGYINKYGALFRFMSQTHHIWLYWLHNSICILKIIWRSLLTCQISCHEDLYKHRHHINLRWYMKRIKHKGACCYRK